MADPLLDTATHRRPPPSLPSELERKLRMCEATVARLAVLQAQVEHELTQIRQIEAGGAGVLRVVPPSMRHAASRTCRRLADKLGPAFRIASQIMR